MSQTLAQQRSTFALQEIQELRGETEAFAKFVKGLPAMILQNGLGHTLAFLLSKKENKHLAAFRIIVKWLKEQKIIQTTSDGEAVIGLSQLGQGDYLRAQQETLAVVEWVKRYAEAGLFLPK
jgi:CRISPR-associated protein Cmr5